MTVLSAEFTFHIPYARSLKDKRTVARSLIAKTRHKFNAAVAETGSQDVHQTLTVGVAVVSSDDYHARAMLDEITRYIDDLADSHAASLVSIETENNE